MKTALLGALFLLLLLSDAKSEDTLRRAPFFSLSDTKGAMVTLEKFRGNIVLLTFWATWCRSCREELAELDGLYSKFRDRGFIVIGISVDDSSDRVAAFLEKRPVGFPVVIDRSGDAAEAYRVSGLPAGFLVSRDGVIMHTYRGSGRELISKYQKDIEDLLKKH